jgi:hypothetical protein
MVSERGNPAQVKLGNRLQVCRRFEQSVLPRIGAMGDIDSAANHTAASGCAPEVR